MTVLHLMARPRTYINGLNGLRHLTHNRSNTTMATSQQGQGRANDLVFAPPTDQYEKGSLDQEQLNKSPGLQFHKWFLEAKEAVPVAEALTLSTCKLPEGRISSRVVLMKELDNQGNIVIYSNWGTSKKAADVKTNPHVALSWFWKELERQVRVEGTIEFLSNEESQVYFDTRPRDSRISAWASPQSEVMESREELEKRVAEERKRFEGVDQIPCPPFWGGIRVKPLEWEFFQGRKNRTHDRFSYTRLSVDDDQWVIRRLAA